MKKLVTSLIFVTLLVVVFAFVGCSGNNDNNNEDPNKISVTGVSISATGLNNGELTVLEGSRDLTLRATVRPSNATDKVVTWASSNTAVATVSDAGVLHIVAGGDATITATADGKQDSFVLHVSTKVAVESLSFKSATYNMEVPTSGSASIDLADEVVINPENATTKSVIWSMSPVSDAITINAQGTVIATNNADFSQTYVVTAKAYDDETKTSTCAITLSTTAAQDMTMRYSAFGSAKADEYVYNFNLADKDISKICFICEPTTPGAVVQCTYSTTDEDVCIMNAYASDTKIGILDIKGVGECDITATLTSNPGVQKTIHVKINDVTYAIDGLNILASELQTEVDDRNYWNFNDNPNVKSGSAWYCTQEYKKAIGTDTFYSNIEDLGWNAKLMPNQGNGSYVEDGGWCTVMTIWDWPLDNEDANGYLFNCVHTPEDATVFKVQLRTQATTYTSGRAKFRIRLVNKNDLSQQVFLNCHGQLIEGFNSQEDREKADVASYEGGTFNPDNGWIVISSVPDYNKGEDYFYMVLPEEWKDRDCYVFIEADDLFEDDGFGHKITGKCDPLLVCSMCFVSNENDNDEFRPKD